MNDRKGERAMSEFDDNRPQNENGDPSPQEEPRPAPEHSGVDAGAAPPPRAP